MIHLRLSCLLLSLAIIALGVIHIGATPHFFPHLTTAAVVAMLGSLKSYQIAIFANKCFLPAVTGFK